MIVDFGEINLGRLTALLLDASNNRATEASQLVAMAQAQPSRPELVTASATAKNDAELLYVAARAIVTGARR